MTCMEHTRGRGVQQGRGMGVRGVREGRERRHLCTVYPALLQSRRVFEHRIEVSIRRSSLYICIYIYVCV